MRAEATGVPLRRSLLVRLLAASTLIAVCSVGATAWLAARTTASAVRQEQGRALADDTAIYNAVVKYAATHRDWHGVTPQVRDLAERTGRRITLTTQDRARTLARSGPADRNLAARESAVIDPLHVDTSLVADAAADGIHPLALGPYRLPGAERRELNGIAGKVLDCMTQTGYPGRVVHRPNGHPRLIVGGGASMAYKAEEVCGTPVLDQPTRTEAKTLARLQVLAGDCLRRHGVPQVRLTVDFEADTGVEGRPSPAAQTCVDSARHEQLAPYVAPPALLFLDTPPTGTTRKVFALSPANASSIAAVAGLVLTLTVSVTVLVGTRLVRPLRALTDAALHPADGHARAPVTTRDEIGHLAAAFNDLSERRERLEEQRRAMVSDVAHELRTPLSNIRAWLEAAEDGLADPDKAFTSSLLEEALQLQHLIDDLQDLAAADAGTLRLHPEPLDVRELLHQVAAAHQASADAADVRLTVRTAGSPHLTADPVRIRQAVANLLTNAIRHTPAGGHVTLTARATAKSTFIEVADTGSGIPPEDLPRVFDRFWRAEKSRNRQTGGSGLGLPIVRQLARAHGGTATVDSTLGTGSVFTLRLPGRPAQDDARP